MRKFKITLRVDGFEGELVKTIKAVDRGAAEVVANIWLHDSSIEIDIADVGVVEEAS